MLNFKVLCIVSCIFAVACATPMMTGMTGGVRELEGNDLKKAEDLLETSLTKLAAGDGPYYTIDEVHSATVQLVAGALYKYKVDLEDQEQQIKKCNVSIWAQTWLPNGMEVTFDCQGEPQVIKNYTA